MEEGVSNDILKFADDSKLWGSVNTKEDILKMQDDLNSLSSWSRNNCMPFNVAKCKVMHLGRKNKKAVYKLMDQVIDETIEEKDLGVHFGETFKPSTNCNKVVKSANKIMGLIRRSISNKSVEGMMILYKTLIRPILDYCVPVWRPYAKKDIQSLERIQKRFTKMINGCKRKSYMERLQKVGISTVEDRYNRADMIQVYKVLTDRNNIYPTNFLVRNNRVSRSNSLKLYKKRANLRISRHSFTFRVIDRWNALPDDVVLSNDVNSFKGRFDNLTRVTRGQV